MAILSTRTMVKSNSTFSVSEGQMMDLITPIRSYKENEEITNIVLDRPFQDVSKSLETIIKSINSRGIYVGSK